MKDRASSKPEGRTMHSMFLKPLREMSDALYKNSIGPRGFPIAATFKKKNNQHINTAVNLKMKDGKKDSHNHAEYQLLSDVDYDKDVIAYISLPPCRDCLKRVIKKGNNHWKIYYFEDLQNRVSNKSYRDFVGTNVELIKFKLDKKTNNQYKLRYYYILWKLFEGYKNKNDTNIDKDYIHERISEIQDKIVSLNVVTGFKVEWLNIFYKKIKTLNDNKK